MRNWCTLFACVSSSLGNLPTTYIVANFTLPAKRPHCRVMLPAKHIQANLRSEICSISLIVTIWIISFKEISELQKVPFMCSNI